MPTIVDVPDVGEIEFPDEMSEADITKALKSEPWNTQDVAKDYTPLPQTEVPQFTGTAPAGIIGAAGTAYMPPAQADYDPVTAATQQLAAHIPEPMQSQIDRYPHPMERLAQIPPNIVGAPRDAVPGVPSEYQVGPQTNLAGEILHGAGRLTKATAFDIPDWIKDAFTPPHIKAQQERQTAELGFEEPGNVETVLKEGMYAQLPAELQIKNMPAPLRAWATGAGGVVEGIPRMLATAGMQAAGVPFPLAAGLAFGTQPQGFDVKAGIIAALLPAIGRGGGSIAASLAKRAGIQELETINYANAIGATAAPAAVMMADQIHSIHNMRSLGLMTDDEATDAYYEALSTTGMSLGLGPMGAKYEKTPVRPPVIPKRTYTPLVEVQGGNKLSEYALTLLDEGRKTVNRGIVVMEGALSGNPFARWNQGRVMQADRDSGQIHVFKEEFERWIEAVPEHRRAEAVERLVNEENLHLSATKSMAMQFWRSLSAVERAIVARIYTGNFDGRDPSTGRLVSMQDMADEALRIRIQQLSRLGTREMAEASIGERWQMAGVTALRGIVANLRLITKEGQSKTAAQRRLMDKVNANLTAAEDAIVRPRKSLTPEQQQAEYENLLREMEEEGYLEAQTDIGLGAAPEGEGPFGRRKPRKEFGQEMLPLDNTVRKAGLMAKMAALNPEAEKQMKLELWENVPQPAGELPLGERPDASQIQKAAAVHGDVRQQPSPRQQEMPLQEGGPRVQPQAQGRLPLTQAAGESFEQFSAGDQPVMADSSGQPIKVYHGTPSKLIEGKIKTPAFFSDKPGTAKTYQGFTEERKPGDLYTRVGRSGNLAEGYIKFKNPLQWTQDRTIGVDEAKKIFATTSHDAILNPKFNEFVVKDANQAFVNKVSPAGGPSAINKTQREFQNDAEEFARANNLPDVEGFGLALGNYLVGGRQAHTGAQELFRKFIEQHPEYSRMGGPAAINKNVAKHEEDLRGRLAPLMEKYKAATSNEEARAAWREMSDVFQRENEVLAFKIASGGAGRGNTKQMADFEAYAVRVFNEWMQNYHDYKQRWGEGQQAFPAAINKRMTPDWTTPEDVETLYRQQYHPRLKTSYHYGPNEIVWDVIDKYLKEHGEYRKGNAYEQEADRYTETSVMKSAFYKEITDAKKDAMNRGRQFSVEDVLSPGAEGEPRESIAKIVEGEGKYPTLRKLMEYDPESMEIYFKAGISTEHTKLYSFARERLMDLGWESDEANGALSDWEGVGRERVIAEDRALAEWIDERVEGHDWTEIKDPNVIQWKPGTLLLYQKGEPWFRRKAPEKFEEAVRNVEEFGPGARKKKGGFQHEIDFEGPTSMTPKAIRGPVPAELLGPNYKKMTPDILKDAIISHIQEGDIPPQLTKLRVEGPYQKEAGPYAGYQLKSGDMFAQFADMARVQWGMTPEQVALYWQRYVQEGISTASGEQLGKLLYRLDLGRSEGRVRVGMYPGPIAEPTKNTQVVGQQLTLEMLGNPDVKPGVALKRAVKRAQNPKELEAQFKRAIDGATLVRIELGKKGLGYDLQRSQLTGEGKVDAEARDLAQQLEIYSGIIEKIFLPEEKTKKAATQKHIAEQAALQLGSPIAGERVEGGVRFRPGEIKREPFKRRTKEERELAGEEIEEKEVGMGTFQPGPPTTSSKLKPGEARRASIEALITDKLLGQSGADTAAIVGRTLTPEHLRYEVGDDVVQRVKPEELLNIPLLGAILTRGSGVDQTTIVRHVVGGKEVTSRRAAPKEAETRNIVAFRDRFPATADKPIILLSVYRASNGLTKVFSPRKTGERAHEELTQKFIDRYEPLYVLRVENPVRNFRQEFPNLDAFKEDFLNEVRRRQKANEATGEAAKATSIEEVQQQQNEAREMHAMGMLSDEGYDERIKLLNLKQQELSNPVTQVPKTFAARPGQVEASLARQQVTPQEARALANAVLGNVEINSPEDVQVAIANLTRLASTNPRKLPQSRMLEYSQARAAMVAMGKLARIIDATDSETMAKYLYGLGDNRETMVRGITEGTTPLGPERPEQLLPSQEYEQSEGRALEMRSPQEIAQENARRAQVGLRPLGEGLERGTAPSSPTGAEVGMAVEPTTVKTEGQAMLPPEAQAALEAARPKKFEPTEADVQRSVKAFKTGFGDLTAEEYKYWMSGWPKFEGGEREISIFDNPAAINKLVKAGVESTSFVGGLMEYYSGWMSPSLRRNGMMSSQFADRADYVIDQKKGYYGGLTPTLDPAKKETGKFRLKGDWFSKLNKVTPNAAVSYGREALEGIRVASVPASHAKALQLADVANREIAKVVVPVTPGHKPSGKMQNIITNRGIDIIKAGFGKQIQDWADGLARANTSSPGGYAMARLAAAKMLGKLKKAFDQPIVNTVHIDKIAQDFHRKFPRAITHVRIPGEGWVQVLQSHLPTYLEAAAQKAAHARAWREVFPSDAHGWKMLMKFRKGIALEGGAAVLQMFDMLTRTLQGHPTDQYLGWRTPIKRVTNGANWFYNVGRTLNETVMNLAAKAVLTKQMVTQLPETLYGPTARYLGYNNYISGLRKANQLYAQLEQEGARNRIMYDWSFDKSAPIRSLFRITGNTLQRYSGQNLLNELQEGFAAATAHVLGERLVAEAANPGSTLSPWEKRSLPDTFRSMGFNPRQVQLLMKGHQPTIMMFKRRASAFLTSGNKHIAEGSALGASRWVNSVFRFQAYPMMKMNQMIQDTRRLAEAVKNKKGIGIASESMARALFQNTMQGALTVGLSAWASGGWDNVKIKYEEAKMHPARFLTEMLLASQSGPLYLLYKQAMSTGAEGWSAQAAQMMFPYSIWNETTDAAFGNGRYKDMEFLPRLGMFVQAKLPGLQPFQLGASYIGLSSKNIPWENARRAFYKWEADYFKGGGGTSSTTEQGEEFRMWMKKAAGAVTRGDEQAKDKAIFEALNAKMKQKPDMPEKEARQSIAASLRGRKMLKNPDGGALTLEQESNLVDQIGEDAYQALKANDDMLEFIAQDMD